MRLPRFLRRDAGVEVDRLYRRHSDEVFRYALMVMRSRPDAEDIVQTVFVRALRAIERGEKVRTPRNWLIKIAHNECRRLMSQRRVHAELPDEISVEPIETGRVTELRAAMAALPEAQRQALVLRELEGRTYVEIATALGLTVSAVETLIFRGRRTLREQIESAMSCEDFALLVDDPTARSRIRAHARICPECATLERQARGRKSALKRIASMLGLPWWGAKLGAVALTAGAGALAATAIAPHHGSTPRPNLIPRSGTRFVVSTTARVTHSPAVARTRKVSDTHRVSDTRAALVVATPSAAPPTTPLPVTTQPAERVHPPAAAVPVTTTPPVTIEPVATPTTVETPTVSTVSAPAVTVSMPAVTVSTPAVVTVPAVTVPAVTVPIPTVPALTVPAATVEIPKVSVP